MYLTASLTTDGLSFPIGRRFADAAALAERGGLDAVWLDTASHGMALDALPLLGALTATTQAIGLGATWSLDHSEPFHVARVMATLDHLSGGRAAWLYGRADDAALFRHSTPIVDALARRREFVDVVARLWDSWEDEAWLLDVASGRFADPARVHPIDHAGACFTVRGPLNVPRPVQGRPVVVQILGDTAADPAADVLLPQQAPDAAADRAPSRAAPGQRILLAHVPDFAASPDACAQAMIARASRTGCDGFNLTLDAGGLARFVDQVVPALRRWGARPATPAGPTLRARLGLPRPRSRTAA